MHNLIVAGDFPLFLLYSIVFYYILRVFIFKKEDRKFKRLLTVFFLLKVFCTVLMTLLIVYYWGGITDNIAYFIESKNLLTLIQKDISNIKYFFLPVKTYNEVINLDNELSATASSLNIESNFLIAKIAAILYPFALGRYLMINLFFSFISSVGQLKLYQALSNRYPHIKKNIAVAILLMPSVLLYSSYINKETLCMGFIGFAIYNLFQIIGGKKRITNSFWLILNLYLIAVIKIYILAAFLMAVVIVYFIKMIFWFWKGSLVSKIFITAFLAVGLWIFLSNLDFFDSYVVDFAEASNSFQEKYNILESSATFELGEVETSFSGLLLKSPLAIYTTYFRPHLWEVNKPIIFFSALESFLVLVITFSAFLIKRKFIRPLLRTDLFANISFIYVLIFGMIVGLTTFNFGSVIRYKIPAVPFLMMFVFLLLHYRPKKVGETEKS